MVVLEVTAPPYTTTCGYTISVLYNLNGIFREVHRREKLVSNASFLCSPISSHQLTQPRGAGPRGSRRYVQVRILVAQFAVLDSIAQAK